jgi:hypothetical protein
MAAGMRHRGAQAPQLGGNGDHAVRHQRDARDDGEAEGQLPMPREAVEQRLRLEQFLQQHEDERAEHRAAQRADAAVDQHQQHGTRLMPGEDLGIDEAVLHRVQEPGEAGEHAAQHERSELVRIRRESDRAHALLVRANAGKRVAKARAADHREQREDQRERSERRVVERARTAEVDEREVADGEHRLHVQVHAVAAAGELGVVKHEVRHLRERERHHDEVNAARTKRERADRRRGESGDGEHGRHEPCERRRIGRGRQQRRGVSADAEERGMAERHQPGVADEELERQREDRQDHRGQHQIDVELAADVRKRRERDQRDGERGDVRGGAERLHQLVRNRPSGRHRRITAIST